MLRTRRVRVLNLGGKESDTGGSVCQSTFSYLKYTSRKCT